nr:protein-disulfide reductase DsbD domain-containing protein [uncultured Sphingomonas sp.]
MFRRLFLALFLLLAAVPAAAQLPRQNAIQPELVIEPRTAPGDEIELAILMHTTPGWHGYWLNPGDAGLPMKVEWQLPKGWSVGELRYPVPQRLLVAGIENYVFEKDYAVLTRLKIPGSETQTQRIFAKLNYLACTDKICVPEKAEISLSVSPQGAERADARFDAWRRALPRPLATPATFQIGKEQISLAIPLPASVALPDPYFFAAEDGAIDYAAPQSFRRVGDMLVVDLQRRRGEPALITGVLATGDGAGFGLSAQPGVVPAGGEPVAGSGPVVSIGWALLGALLGGLLLNLMPCVFPILALKGVHLARSGGDERAARNDAMAYAAGAVLGTGALGAILLIVRAGGEAAGWAFQLQDPRIVLLLLLLAVAITLNLLRLFELPVLAGDHNPAGSFGTGALAAFVATPCAGPFLGAALGAALLLPAAGSMAVFASLGLGLALPFVAIAFIPALRSRLPKPGPWMARLQRILAIPMALTAAACLWLLWRQAGSQALWLGIGGAALLTLLLWGWGQSQRQGRSLGLMTLIGVLLIAAVTVRLLPAAAPATQRTLPANVTPWSEDAVRIAVMERKRPVFVDFTADWCLSCKANEAGAINRDATQQAFGKAGVVQMVGDWTDGDPAITRMLESRGRAGVPLYLWYEPGKTEPEELPQILTPSMLIERAERRR